MNDEIKEILDKFKDYNLTTRESKILLDYITNLQQEINKLTAESTEWESKYYDIQDNFHNANNELTNLQQENKVLENEKDMFYKVSQERLNKWLSLNDENNKLVEIIKDYKSRIEKAVEYVDVITDKGIYESGYGKGTAITICKEHLLDILKGRSDE